VSDYFPVFFAPLGESEIPTNMELVDLHIAICTEQIPVGSRSRMRCVVSRNWWLQDMTSRISQELKIGGLAFNFPTDGRGYIVTRLAFLQRPEIIDALSGLDRLIDVCRRGPPVFPILYGEGDAYINVTSAQYREGLFEAAEPSASIKAPDFGDGELPAFYSYLKTLRASLADAREAALPFFYFVFTPR
jgi:hypothetical protein